MLQCTRPIIYISLNKNSDYCQSTPTHVNEVAGYSAIAPRLFQSVISCNKERVGGYFTEMARCIFKLRITTLILMGLAIAGTFYTLVFVTDERLLHESNQSVKG